MIKNVFLSKNKKNYNIKWHREKSISQFKIHLFNNTSIRTYPEQKNICKISMIESNFTYNYNTAIIINYNTEIIMNYE